MFIYPSSKYLGNWLYDKRNGYGEIYLETGSFYEGEWVNDTKQGYGK